MERRPKFTEEKTSYELERDKHVAELAKKLLLVTKAAAKLWVFLFLVTISTLGVGRNLSFSVSVVNLKCSGFVVF
jgi:hypothetical protein